MRPRRPLPGKETKGQARLRLASVFCDSLRSACDYWPAGPAAGVIVSLPLESILKTKTSSPPAIAAAAIRGSGRSPWDQQRRRNHAADAHVTPLALLQGT